MRFLLAAGVAASVAMSVIGGSRPASAATTPSTNWTQRAELSDPAATAEDFFGRALAISQNGDTALIGAQQNSRTVGAAYVFTRSGPIWTQRAELTANDGAIGDFFASSVALDADGDTAVIGAPQKDHQVGTAYIFTATGGRWGQRAELTASDPAVNNNFGSSVALGADGTTALVGSPGTNGSSGATYVFSRSGATWSLQAELTPPNGDANSNFFGASVALGAGGRTALVGAGGNGSFTGAAFVFTRSGMAWTQQAKLTANDGVPGDEFGDSVALGDGTALIGLGRPGGARTPVYIFTRAGQTWTQQAEFTARDGAPNEEFGFSVALDARGKTALIGAIGRQGDIEGSAYIYFRSGAAWIQQAEVTASDAAPTDEFATSVAIDGDGRTALIGAGYKNSDAGVAYVFRK